MFAKLKSLLRRATPSAIDPARTPSGRKAINTLRASFELLDHGQYESSHELAQQLQRERESLPRRPSE
jgi:hypothetical protein